MTISNDIASMQNQTEYNKMKGSSSDTSDQDMFLTLMLQQMQNQDPTEPVDNQQWLAQLAQYSSLEQMTNMNEGLAGVAEALEQLTGNIAQSNSITQTLSLVGKEVDIVDPEDPEKKISGEVTEASFEGGEGKIKVNGKYYSIAYVQSVRDAGSTVANASR